MSMVAAPNLRIGTMTRDSDYQRFNVAASRARDQMILLHSVELGDLNPQCTRYRLLEYCKNPQRVQLEVDEVKEEFDFIQAMPAVAIAFDCKSISYPFTTRSIFLPSVPI
jgi:hypothetical protein